MELEEFKNIWNRSDITEPPEVSIDRIIKQKSRGPVAALQSRFRKALIILPVISVYIITMLSKRNDLLSIVLGWYFIGFFVFIYGYFIINYMMIRKIATMDTMVKTLLEKNVAFMENSARFRLITVRVMLVTLFLVIELLFYYSPEVRIVWIFKYSLLTRLVIYTIITIVFYILTKRMIRRRYFNDINRLKNLIQEVN